MFKQVWYKGYITTCSNKISVNNEENQEEGKG